MLAFVERASHGLLRVLGAKSTHVPTSVGHVHTYELSGAGDGTFVLIHGMGATATAYTAVVRRLTAGARRILVPDLPGHGRSGAPSNGLDVASLAAGLGEALDALLTDDDPAVLLGTSLGGAVALGYALERPSRVRALVLASPAGAPLSESDFAELRARFDLRTRADARRFFTELMHAPPWYLRALERGLVDQLGQPTVQGFLASLGANDFFTPERLATLKPPATVLWGKSDRILPRSGLGFYQRALPPQTRFEEIEGVGHSPHFERPALVARRLLEAYASASRSVV